MQKSPDISVVVPISERHDDMRLLYKLYADKLTTMKNSFEFVFVLDGDFNIAGKALQELKDQGNPIRIIKLAKSFGESTALMEGFRQAKGKAIITLASYIQIEPEDLFKVFSAYKEGNDMVITRRFPRKDPLINRVQSIVYHYLIRKLTGSPFKDITSGMRLFDKKVLSEVVLYGDLHRFIPIFALERGLKVKEVKVTQRKEDTQVRVVKPGTYLRRILDIITLFFLVKFTKKPLRFFGLMGTALFLPGFFVSTYLALMKLFSEVSLSEKPLLLAGILLMIFGIQIFSVGLVGELILFSHAKDIEDYKIEEVIE